MSDGSRLSRSLLRLLNDYSHEELVLTCYRSSVGCFVLDITRAYIFLSYGDISFHTAVMPFHTYVFTICRRGYKKTWTSVWIMSHDSPYPPMQSLGR